MKFYEHVDRIVGSRDRVVCGPQRQLTEEELRSFEDEVYHKELNIVEKGLVPSLVVLTQYALAHVEAGLDVIGAPEERTIWNYSHPRDPQTVDSLLEYIEDRHTRVLGTHPSSPRIVEPESI